MESIIYIKPMRIFLFCLCILFTVPGCGFTPLHGGGSRTSTPPIHVDAPDSRIGQLFTHTLLNGLYGERDQPRDAPYAMTVTLAQDEFPIDIRSDHTVTRYRIRLTGTYTLTRLADGSVIDKGSVIQSGGYDRVESDYATYVSARALKERAAEALAEDFRQYLIRFFASRTSEGPLSE